MKSNTRDHNLSNWYLVYTLPKHERRICSNFVQTGIDFFFPLKKVLRQWADRKKWVEVPLFPSYIFVRVSKRDRPKVFGVRGVLKFISNDGSPTLVGENVINSIKLMLFGNPEATNESFSAGQLLYIRSGPMAGLSGILIEKKGRYRIAMRLHAMNQTIVAEVSSEDIQRAIPITTR